MKQPFLKDDDFFKSTTLNEQGDLIKSKRYQVGEVSQKTGLKKVGPNKWVDPKTGKVVDKKEAEKGQKGTEKPSKYKVGTKKEYKGKTVEKQENGSWKESGSTKNEKLKSPEKKDPEQGDKEHFIRKYKHIGNYLEKNNKTSSDYSLKEMKMIESSEIKKAEEKIRKKIKKMKIPSFMKDTPEYNINIMNEDVISFIESAGSKRVAEDYKETLDSIKDTQGGIEHQNRVKNLKYKYYIASGKEYK